MGVSSMTYALVIISLWLQNHCNFDSHPPWTNTLEISIIWSDLRVRWKQSLSKRLWSQVITKGEKDESPQSDITKLKKKKKKWKHFFRILEVDNLKTSPQKASSLIQCIKNEFCPGLSCPLDCHFHSFISRRIRLKFTIISTVIFQTLWEKALLFLNR